MYISETADRTLPHLSLFGLLRGLPASRREHFPQWAESETWGVSGTKRDQW